MLAGAHTALETRYDVDVKLPFDRARMRERNLLDDIDEIEQAARLTPEQRFIRALDLCEFCLSLGRANPTGTAPPSETLAAKAKLWTLPRTGSTR
jgi:hypothetical protein